MTHAGSLFIVSGPSGAGKTTLVDALINNMNSYYYIARAITYTTRAPRIGEVHGVDYYFVTSDEFEQKIASGFFLEWSNAYGAYYGSGRNIVDQLANGHSPILILDRDGARQVLTRIDTAVLIWIYPSSLKALRDRLEKRGTDLPDSIVRRLDMAKVELEKEEINPLYHYHILNEILAISLDCLEKVIKKTINLKKNNIKKSLLYKAEKPL